MGTVSAASTVTVPAHRSVVLAPKIVAAAQNGWLDLDRCRDESLVSIRRAGADMILSYFAKAYAQSISK